VGPAVREHHVRVGSVLQEVDDGVDVVVSPEVPAYSLVAAQAHPRVATALVLQRRRQHDRELPPGTLLQEFDRRGIVGVVVVVGRQELHTAKPPLVTLRQRLAPVGVGGIDGRQREKAVLVAGDGLSQFPVAVVGVAVGDRLGGGDDGPVDAGAVHAIEQGLRIAVDGPEGPVAEEGVGVDDPVGFRFVERGEALGGGRPPLVEFGRRVPRGVILGEQRLHLVRDGRPLFGREIRAGEFPHVGDQPRVAPEDEAVSTQHLGGGLDLSGVAVGPAQVEVDVLVVGDHRRAVLPVAAGADVRRDDLQIREGSGEFGDVVGGRLVGHFLVALLERVGDVGDQRQVVLDGHLRQRVEGRIRHRLLEPDGVVFQADDARSVVDGFAEEPGRVLGARVDHRPGVEQVGVLLDVADCLGVVPAHRPGADHRRPLGPAVPRSDVLGVRHQAEFVDTECVHLLAHPLGEHRPLAGVGTVFDANVEVTVDHPRSERSADRKSMVPDTDSGTATDPAVECV